MHVNKGPHKYRCMCVFRVYYRSRGSWRQIWTHYWSAMTTSFGRPRQRTTCDIQQLRFTPGCSMWWWFVCSWVVVARRGGEVSLQSFNQKEPSLLEVFSFHLNINNQTFTRASILPGENLCAFFNYWHLSVNLNITDPKKPHLSLSTPITAQGEFGHFSTCVHWLWMCVVMAARD